MVFSSALFLFAFLPVTYLLYIMVPGIKAKNFILMIMSLVFYSFGRPDWLVLLMVSVGCNYFAGLMIKKLINFKKIVLTTALIINLGILFCFKYLNFFTEILSGFCAIVPTSIALPIGVSFFTFQGMSYVIDVYRNPDMASRSFCKVLLYIAFFPQLVAGPIVKYGDICDQIDNRISDAALTVNGIARFVKGLVKKLFFANTLGYVADAVYAMDGAGGDMRLAWLGVICYTLQIYYDFSAYSDMAIGLGKIFGFRINENFRHPYVASSVKEFWRRWHISLSSWFREYLYIPLGGNRKGVWRARFNRFVVFFCTGFWHGANWTFVVWGMWHALFLFAEEGFKSKKNTILSHIYTLVVVMVGFAIFRADNLAAAFDIVRGMFAGFDFSYTNTAQLCNLLTPSTMVTLAAGIVFATPVCDVVLYRLRTAGIRIPSAVRAVLVICAYALCVIKLASSSFNPFIYTQF